MEVKLCAFGDVPATKQFQRLVLASWRRVLLEEGNCGGPAGD